MHLFHNTCGIGNMILSVMIYMIHLWIDEILVDFMACCSVFTFLFGLILIDLIEVYVMIRYTIHVTTSIKTDDNN